MLQKNAYNELEGYSNKLESTIESMAERRTLWKHIKKRINVWIGHVLRHSGLLGLTD